MITDSPVYTLGNWQGNVTDTFGVDWVVTGEDGWSSSPPVRTTLEDRQTADGAWAGPGLYGARVISLTGKAMAGDRAAMLAAKERLKASISARQRLQLIVDEAHLSRFAWVRLSDQIEITDWGSRGFDWSLILVAADPRRYAVDGVSASTPLPLAVAVGRTYPRAFPYSYGGGGGSGRVYFVDEGDFDQCPATITVTGPVTNPQVAHVQSGKSLTFALTLSDSDYLQLDLMHRTALLNGTASRAATITPGSAWFMCQPGLNEIQFRGTASDSGLSTPPVMTITAASAWT